MMEDRFAELVGADAPAPDAALLTRLRRELNGLTHRLECAGGGGPAASETNPAIGAWQCFCMVPDDDAR